MAELCETVVSWCWLLPALGTIYLWVVTFTTFSTPHKSNECSLTPSPSPALTASNPYSLQSSISACLCWMAMLYCSSAMITFYVRTIVDCVASAEAKGDALEDEGYKVACEGLKEAIKTVEAALAKAKSNPTLRGAYVTVVGMRNVAIAKAVNAKPKEGLARLPRRRQIRVRIAFVLDVFFSFVARGFASFAFYYSLELQNGCKHGAAEIGPFSLVGLLFLSVHLQDNRSQ